MASVIVLGAKGRFGRAAVAAFSAAGWEVTALARSWPVTDAPLRAVSVDVMDAPALARACVGHDVIVNAVHPPYPKWSTDVPRITASVIAAARTSGATVMIPGNLYNYGSDLPSVLDEDTPWRGDIRKGDIRIQMERAFRDSGVPTIVLRAGDFIEAERTGNWFDSHIAARASRGRLVYPGPRDLDHVWAYLPDMARAMVGLAQRREDFAAFEEFGFEGYALTGNDLCALVEQAMGREMRVGRFPWWALRILALGHPLMREVVEMRYLWTRPHRIDGTKLRRTLPEFKPTPASVAIEAALVAQLPADLGATRTA